MTESLAGTRTLIRLILRRDRVRLPVWILGIVAMTVLIAASFPGLYETEAARQARAELMENPVATALGGPGHGLEDYTFGAMMANEMLAWTAIFFALMSVFLVVRHTRTEEETGRSELVRAAVVGRHAAAAAALTVVTVAHLVMAVLIAISLPPFHEHYTLVGSVAFGLSLASVGIVFAGVAFIAAQLTEHGRGAVGYGAAAIGVAFTLRAAGDIAFTPLSWLSPIGWAQATRPYVDELWWPLLLAVAFAAVLVAIGLVLSTRRDVGGGLIHAQPGPRRASRTLAHPLGLALRLQRGLMLGWGLGLLLAGFVYGSLINEVQEFAEDNQALQDLVVQTGGAAFEDSFVAMLLLMNAMLVAAFVIQSTLQLRGEETAGHAEPLLATALPRWRWAAAGLTVSMIGGPAILVLSAAGMGVAAVVVSGEVSWLPRITGASLAHFPVLWLMAGLAMALFGLAPRWAAAAWLVLGYGLTEWLIGALLGLPAWMADLSPFRHVPQMPAEDFAVVPIVALTGLAAAFLAAGLVGLQRRDIATV